MDIPFPVSIYPFSVIYYFADIFIDFYAFKIYTISIYSSN